MKLQDVIWKAMASASARPTRNMARTDYQSGEAEPGSEVGLKLFGFIPEPRSFSSGIPRRGLGAVDRIVVPYNLTFSRPGCGDP